MNVRPIFIQKDGAIFGMTGSYRSLPPPMAGKYAGSDEREDITYYTVNSSGEAELKTVKAYPFYVDSISGGLDTSGDGTLESPWRSVNHALTILQPILYCLMMKYCCEHFIVLRITGTVDYRVVLNTGSDVRFYGYDRLIIEPYSESNIFAQRWDSLSNCIFKNAKINSDLETGNIACLFYACYNCVFNECGVENITYQSRYRNACFLYCNNAILFDCSIVMAGLGNHASGAYILSAVEGCNNVICNQISAILSGDTSNISAFNSNPNSIFKSCSGNVSSFSGENTGCGFKGNTDSVFLDCIGNSFGEITCDI